MSDELLSIGAFAELSGLSVPALRHYDEVGILRPAEVDERTGYRRYRPEQAGAAGLIRALRSVALAIDDVRDVLTGADAKAILAEHRERLSERVRQLTELVCSLDQYIDKGVPVRSANRITQIKINVTDHAKAVAFYENAFGVTFNEDISSFQFGAYKSEQFFLLTIEPSEGDPWKSWFGLLVDDLDAAHERVVAAGATEWYPPTEYSWKPRCSGVTDPSGNRIELYQE